MVFFASPLAVPLVSDASPPFLFVAAAVAFATVFLTTVLVLPSLASLFALIRRPVRVAGLDAGARDAAGAAAAAARRVLVAGAAAAVVLELLLDVVVTFLAPAARDDFAFSTMFERRFVATAVRVPEVFKGEPGLAICDLAGDTGRPLFSRELDDVGERTWAGRTGPPPGTCPRVFFFGCSMFSISFSLS